MARKHLVDNRNLELALAFTALILGFWMLWDSYDNRDGKVPWFLQWLTFWG